ncbi:hypothetical protein [Allosphingosinicella sp.]|uniref:hypothetical protein n=1 Tax=Allosphingosinicella sp. TaxID=2823234 RepID=UPI0037840D43
MKRGTILMAGAALLALAACSKRDEATPDANGIITKGGLQVNAMSAVTNCISPSDMNRPMSQIGPEQRRQLVGCLNAATARQVNAQLPRQIDEITRLDSLSTQDATLTYHYTVLRPAASLPPNSAEQLAAATRRLTCANPQARQTLEFGGSYAFRWVDSQGAVIHEMRIDAC